MLGTRGFTNTTSPKHALIKDFMLICLLWANSQDNFFLKLYHQTSFLQTMALNLKNSVLS